MCAGKKCSSECKKGREKCTIRAGGIYIYGLVARLLKGRAGPRDVWALIHFPVEDRWKVGEGRGGGGALPDSTSNPYPVTTRGFRFYCPSL
jgi:hypothetical protein